MSVKEFGVGFRDHEENYSRDIIRFVDLQFKELK